MELTQIKQIRKYQAFTSIAVENQLHIEIRMKGNKKILGIYQYCIGKSIAYWDKNESGGGYRARA